MSIPTPNSQIKVAGAFFVLQILAVIIIVACIDHPVKWGWLVAGTLVAAIGYLITSRMQENGIASAIVMIVSLLITYLAI